MLIKCPECGKEVSDKAPACIHCGFPLDAGNHRDVENSMITCPECGSQIPDTAGSCPICGCPGIINQAAPETAEKESDDGTYNVILTEYSCSKNDIIRFLNRRLHIQSADAVELAKKVPCIIKKNCTMAEFNEIKSVAGTFNAQVAFYPYSEGQSEWKILQKFNSGSVHCPHCGSTSISTGQRGYSLLTGIYGSGRTVNRCAKCGYTWKP